MTWVAWQVSLAAMAAQAEAAEQRQAAEAESDALAREIRQPLHNASGALQAVTQALDAGGAGADWGLQQRPVGREAGPRVGHKVVVARHVG